MSLLLDLKLGAQILGLVILVITLVLTLRRLTTNSTATQTLPGDNLADNNGVTISSQDTIQLITLNVNPL